MPEHTYKLIDLVGASSNSIDEAIQNAVSRAGETLKGLDWFEVQQIRGTIRDGRVALFQVEIKVGFRIMDPKDLSIDSA